MTSTRVALSLFGCASSLAGGALLLAVSVARVALELGDREPSPEEIAATQQAADAGVRSRVAAALTPSPSPESPGMVYVPAGEFVLGRMNHDPDALASEPLAQIMSIKAFFIDRDESPDAGLDAGQAEQACGNGGKRLCTAVEWEKACKGAENSIYGYDVSGPAGAYDPAMCPPTPGGALCRSDYGVHDMSGGLGEWTATAPQGKAARRLVKGGHGRNPERATRCAYALDELQTFRDDDLTYRCCRDAP